MNSSTKTNFKAAGEGNGRGNGSAIASRLIKEVPIYYSLGIGLPSDKSENQFLLGTQVDPNHSALIVRDFPCMLERSAGIKV